MVGIQDRRKTYLQVYKFEYKFLLRARSAAVKAINEYGASFRGGFVAEGNTRHGQYQRVRPRHHPPGQQLAAAASVGHDQRRLEEDGAPLLDAPKDSL